MDLGYVFLEPASFLTVSNQDQRKEWFQSWLRYWSALIYQMTDGQSTVHTMSNMSWKVLLGLDYLQQHGMNKADTQNGKLRDSMEKYLQCCLDAEGVTVDDSPQGSVSWHGKAFDTLSNANFKEILWELAELNFCFEFLALDYCTTFSNTNKSFVESQTSNSPQLDEHQLFLDFLPLFDEAHDRVDNPEKLARLKLKQQNHRAKEQMRYSSSVTKSLAKADIHLLP